MKTLPKNNSLYWYIYPDDQVKSGYGVGNEIFDEFDDLDLHRFETGNCYETEKKAIEEIEKRSNETNKEERKIMNELIKIEQLPIIVQQFQEKKEEVEARVAPFMKMEVTEENRKEVKSIRADLNKEAAEYQNLYKQILTEVEAPILKFKEAYKENIQSYYSEADKALKVAIDQIENDLKDKKEKAVQDYFEEYKYSLNNEYLEFATWGKMNLKVGLSDTEKKLKETVKNWLDEVSKDTKAIVTMALCDEIFTEYAKHLDLSKAIADVEARRKAQEEMAEKRRVQEEADAEAKRKAAAMQAAAEPEQEEVLQAPEVKATPVEAAPDPAPEIQQEKKYTMKFKVEASKEKLIKLKAFLVENAIEFESLK